MMIYLDKNTTFACMVCDRIYYSEQQLSSFCPDCVDDIRHNRYKKEEA